MKRILLSLLAISFAFVFACQTQNVNVNKNANVNLNANANASNQAAVLPMTVSDKVVQIFIYDDLSKPGYYVIDDPGSLPLHKKKNQKITWCVIYDGSTPPSDVVIDNFRSPPPPATPTATNPFGDGGPQQNSFDIASADFGKCNSGTKTPKANADLGAYKYTITVKVNGSPRGVLDPEVVISE
jgi:hypothetical protein